MAPLIYSSNLSSIVFEPYPARIMTNLMPESFTLDQFILPLCLDTSIPFITVIFSLPLYMKRTYLISRFFS